MRDDGDVLPVLHREIREWLLAKMQGYYEANESDLTDHNIRQALLCRSETIERTFRILMTACVNELTRELTEDIDDVVSRHLYSRWLEVMKETE